MLPLTLYITIIALCGALQGVAQMPGRTPIFNDTDSVWFQQRLLGANKFFLGTDVVTQYEWIRFLKNKDKEVDELIAKARKRSNIGTVVAITAGSVSSLILLRNSDFFIPSTNQGFKNQLIVLGTSLLAGTVVSSLYSVSSAQHYIQAMRLYNYKLANGTLAPVTVHLGTGHYGWGVVLRW
jgi:hypothetical protein